MDPPLASYFEELAAAFARGRLGLPRELGDVDAIEQGRQAGLKLHKFKRQSGLPRVKKVLGLLRGMAPQSLLDVGSGRGTFLWPLLDALPSLTVLGIDIVERRAGDLQAVRRGGIDRLFSARMDACALALAPGSFEVVTALEVLEHLPDPARAIREVMRVAARFVVASVPSHEDANPEHLHLLDQATLEREFSRAGATRITFDHVHDHLILVARR
jgi:ubiquinone/menaquinone biosynthesis C-methylase UbiE